jgi:hypothetical protein
MLEQQTTEDLKNLFMKVKSSEKYLLILKNYNSTV